MMESLLAAANPSCLVSAELSRTPPEGISVGAKDDNLFLWEILIVGPPGTVM